MILLYGPAGSGKTTQGKILAEKFGWKFVSAGGVLREAAKTNVGLAQILESGSLVPSGFVNELIFKAVDPVGGGNIIIDGYPREIQEIQDLIERYGSSMISAAIVFELSDEESANRLRSRGRADDDEEGIARRLQIYHEEMGVIQQFLDDHRVRTLKIDASPGIEEISNNLEGELKKWQILT